MTETPTLTAIMGNLATISRFFTFDNQIWLNLGYLLVLLSFIDFLWWAIWFLWGLLTLLSDLLVPFILLISNLFFWLFIVRFLWILKSWVRTYSWIILRIRLSLCCVRKWSLLLTLILCFNWYWLGTLCYIHLLCFI